MIEAIANAIRPPLQKRWRDGQPFIAIELIYIETEHGLEWMLCLVCEREVAPTLEGIIAQAYPDVWLGRRFDEQPSRCRRGAARSRLRAAAAKASPLPVSAVATDRTRGEPGAQAELAARGDRASAGRGGDPVDRTVSADAGDRGARAALPAAAASTRASRPPLVGEARPAHPVSRRGNCLRGRGAGPRAVSPRAPGGGARLPDRQQHRRERDGPTRREPSAPPLHDDPTGDVSPALSDRVPAVAAAAVAAKRRVRRRDRLPVRAAHRTDEGRPGAQADPAAHPGAPRDGPDHPLAAAHRGTRC